MSLIDLFHLSIVFFFNDTATTEIYTLPLHDALPIHRQHRNLSRAGPPRLHPRRAPHHRHRGLAQPRRLLSVDSSHPPSGADRKSTRLNSSHANISYAVFCLKKKKKNSRPEPVD